MKEFITEKEAQLPLDGIEVLKDELMFVLGGAAAGAAGSGCGCSCNNGNGCGCDSGKGCGCENGSGCGCGCNSPADNTPAQ
ncbi:MULTISPECIES: hypothetical protein [Bacteroides]|uniref:Uncharacterized protein n=1 Tax=Bacteroides muris (ex Fokt et al. 2023) TaxID=2937417 RepID=A0A9X2P0Z0_9BACE|nr:MULTISPECIES: hypothetical protein [Bacteroides]MCR6508601.1 hypothetical protein [Bacteroides muris (ex Fokt et al. 2023)]